MTAAAPCSKQLTIRGVNEMKRIKTAGLMLLIFAMLLAACSGGDRQTEAADGEAAAAPVELTMAFFTFGSTPADLPAVQDAINKIASEKINAKVKLLPISFGAWNQQMNLMLTAGERLDLLVTGSSPTLGYSSQVAKGHLLALDELVRQYGQDIAAAMDPAFLRAGQINGEIYGIPTLRDMASNNGVLFRKDLLDKHGLNAGEIKTIDDLEKALKLLSDNEPGLTLAAANGSIVDHLVNIDNLGDFLGVLLNGGAELKVVNWFETPEYAELLRRVRDWYEKGYILKDLATNKEATHDLVKGQRSFGFMNYLKPGIDPQESRFAGIPMVSASLTEPLSTTSKVTNIMWGIPRHSQYPEKAMQFLNLMYSDKEIINLFDWGIEGKHYVKTGTENVIKFPDGVDASNSGYNLNQGWMFGNQYLSYVFEGDDPEIYIKTKEFSNSAIKSKALGFTFDSTPVKTEIAALTNVLDQFKPGLESGALDPEKNLPEFIAKLRAAGIEKVIAEKQKQLDAWAAQQ